MEKTKYDVFISYSSKDLERVQMFVKLIKTNGLKCWYDKDMDPGKSGWMEQIMVALEESDKVLLYLTKNAIDSGDVKNEITNASAKGKNIIPIIAEDINIPDSYLYLIRKYEWIYSYKMDEKSLMNILQTRILDNYNEKRELFWGTLQTKEFVEFSNSVMEHYYGKHFFTTINDREFAVMCVHGKPLGHVNSIKDFDVLCDFDGSHLADFDIRNHQSYIHNKWYAEYSALLDGKIRYPNRPGYMLDEISTDINGSFDRIKVHVGTFAENVYSTHVLEYELYRAFMEYRCQDLNDPFVWQQLKDSLSIRNKIHTDVIGITGIHFNEKMRLSLLSGAGRDSLLSVQMLVVIKSKRTKKYEVKIIQRSNDVVIKPGIWQFIPSGGFEILNDSDDNAYSDIELEENFSPGCAIFREYLEELFNVPEFEGGGSGSIEERLLKDNRIIAIENMLRDGAAELQFLGSVVDLAALRHELSFVLVIHDDSYSETQFIVNEESKKRAVYNIPLQDFDHKSSIWRNIHGPSAAMWHLFKQAELYKSLIRC